MPFYKRLQGWVLGQLVGALTEFVNRHDLGATWFRMNYDILNGDSPIANASFVSHETYRGIPDTTYTVAPDLAVKPALTGDADTHLLSVVESFLTGGSHRVWLVSIERQTVYVFWRIDERTLSYKPYRAGDTVLGEGTLAGFALPVADIFPKPK